MGRKSVGPVYCVTHVKKTKKTKNKKKQCTYREEKGFAPVYRGVPGLSSQRAKIDLKLQINRSCLVMCDVTIMVICPLTMSVLPFEICPWFDWQHHAPQHHVTHYMVLSYNSNVVPHFAGKC